MVAATGPPCWEAPGHLPMPQPTRRCARTRHCGRAVGMAAMDGPSRLSPRGGHSGGTSSWPYMAGGWQPTRGAPGRQLLAPGSAARGRSVTPGDVAMSRAAVDTGPRKPPRRRGKNRSWGPGGCMTDDRGAVATAAPRPAARPKRCCPRRGRAANDAAMAAEVTSADAGTEDGLPHERFSPPRPGARHGTPV